MLNYEKKLHLDERYKNMQSLNIIKRAVALIWGCVGYIVLYLLLKYVLLFVTDIQPWNNSDELFALYNISFSRYDCVYFALGILTNLYASLKLAKITAQNHSVKNKKDDNPTKLLTDGCYAKVRHPMYGNFIILQSCFLLSLRSLWGIVLALVIAAFQCFNAMREENEKLIPIFKEEYKSYSKSARSMLLTKWEFIILTSFFIVSIVGLVIR